jgi:hypothetical protein
VQNIGVKRVDNNLQKTGRVMTAALPTVTRNSLIEVVTQIGGQNNVRRFRQDTIEVLLPQSPRHSARQPPARVSQNLRSCYLNHVIAATT